MTHLNLHFRFIVKFYGKRKHALSYPSHHLDMKYNSQNGWSTLNKISENWSNFH